MSEDLGAAMNIKRNTVSRTVQNIKSDCAHSTSRYADLFCNTRDGLVANVMHVVDK